MAVRVEKPAFNLRSKLNELDRPVGAFGNQVLATENRYDASKLIGGGRKNLLINGDFKISQRGDYTSATAVTDDAYYLDRWKMRESGTAIAITHNKNISITEAGGDGIKTNSAKIDITSSNNGYWALRQIVEDFAAVSGQTVTFSCWVRGVGPKVFFRLWGISNIGHGHALTEDWQFYTETFSAPAVTGAIDGNNGFVPTIGNYAEANVYNHTADWCEVALFQVEVGRSPTPFEFRTEAEELALCQRFFVAWPPRSGGTPAWTIYTGSNQASAYIWIPYTMRTTPTPTDKGTGTSTTTGYAYNNIGQSVSSRYANNTSPTLSCGGENGHYSLKMDFGAYGSGGHEADVASWNGTSPGIFLDSEL